MEPYAVRFTVPTRADEVDPLSPPDWSHYKGQSRLKADLDVRIRSATLRGEPLDHVLLIAGPGMGKTTLAKVIASKLGKKLHTCPTPIDETALLRMIKRKMSDGDVLFLDECHQIAQSRGQAEVLLPILQDGKSRHGMKIKKITIVAATTEPDKLPQPFVDRFPIQPHFEEYTISEMRDILSGMLERMDVMLEYSEVHALARASNATPRLAGHLARAARDLYVTGDMVPPTAEEVLNFAQIRPDGLERVHEKYLAALYRFYAKDTAGGTLYRSGIMNLARILDLKPAAVERVERALIKRGLIQLTGSGRELTEEGITLAQAVVGKHYS